MKNPIAHQKIQISVFIVHRILLFEVSWCLIFSYTRGFSHPGLEVGSLKGSQAPCLGARSGCAFKLADALSPSLDTKDRLLDTGAGHGLAVIYGRQTANIPLRGATRRVDAGRVGRLDKAFANNIEHAFFRLGEVTKRVLLLRQEKG